MADIKISQFPDGGPVQITDDIAAVRSGNNVRVQVKSGATKDAGDSVGEVLEIADDGAGNPVIPPGITTPADQVSFDKTGTAIDATDAQDAIAEVSTRALVYECGNSAGTNTVLATTVAPMAAYATGQMFEFSVAVTNTGAATLNVNTLGAKNLKKRGPLSNALVDLGAGDLSAGMRAVVIYDGTNAVLLNPAPNTTAANLTAATTLDLSAVTGDIFSVTGSAANIGAVSNAAEGREFVMVMGNTSTLVHSATWINPTAANIVCAVGDVVRVRIIAGVPNVVGFQRTNGTPLMLTVGAPASGQVPAWNGSQFVPFTLPFKEVFVATGQACPAAAGLLDIAHGLTGRPFLVIVSAVMTTAQNNYAIGDEMFLGYVFQNSTSHYGIQVIFDDNTNIYIRAGSAGPLGVLNKTTGGITTNTPANSTLTVRAFR